MNTSHEDRSSRPARVAERIAAIAAEYGVRRPRGTLGAVERLREALPPPRSIPVIGVVGTNGKTSTATYLARLLAASGVRTGLYVSPHLSDWTERIRIDDVPCEPDELVEAITTVQELARSNVSGVQDLRFFDVLTLAAEQIFSRAGASIAVFEAGIGGRLDAIRVLEPGLVLLTDIAIDHAEILGETRSEILREKLLVAPAGATVLTFRLGAELDEVVREVASELCLRTVWVEPGLPALRDSTPDIPAFLRSALTLAEEGRRVAAEILGAARPGDGALEVPVPVDLRLPGRFDCGERDGVPYVLDVGHNDGAWREFAAEVLRRFGDSREAVPLSALVSVSPSKGRAGLAAALKSMPGLDGVLVTRHTALPAEDPSRVAEELRTAGLEASAVESVGAAAALAFERARDSGGRVIAFGSTHLVADVRHWLGSGGAVVETAQE